MSYLAPKIWSLVPTAIKSSKSLDAFKSKIRQWEPDCHVVYIRLTCKMSVSFSISLLTFSKALQTQCI